MFPANLGSKRNMLYFWIKLNFSPWLIECAYFAFNEVSPKWKQCNIYFTIYDVSIKDIFSKWDQICSFQENFFTVTKDILNGKLYLLCSDYLMKHFHWFWCSLLFLLKNVNQANIKLCLKWDLLWSWKSGLGLLTTKLSRIFLSSEEVLMKQLNDIYQY